MNQLARKRHLVGGTSLQLRFAVRPKTSLWVAAIATALAAVWFPKVEGVKNNDSSPWGLLAPVWPTDREGLVLIPLVIMLTFALFALVGRWAWSERGTSNRPAKAGLVCGVLGLVGVTAFFVSAPIIFGGLAVTLGVEGRRRARTEGGGTPALAAIVVGAVAFVVGAGIWLAA